MQVVNPTYNLQCDIRFGDTTHYADNHDIGATQKRPEDYSGDDNDDNDDDFYVDYDDAHCWDLVGDGVSSSEEAGGGGDGSLSDLVPSKSL